MADLVMHCAYCGGGCDIRPIRAYAMCWHCFLDANRRVDRHGVWFRIRAWFRGRA